MARANVQDIDYYDCTGKTNGLYRHPSDCTRYIVCANGTAVDMACPDCDPSNVAGCEGSPHLFFDLDKGQCVWPRDTPCVIAKPDELDCYPT